MQLLDEQLILSASDINSFLACPDLTTLDLASARGELEAVAEITDGQVLRNPFD